MQNATAKPELRVTVFSDYICPFCYIGDARLAHLRDDYALRVNWCFLEIHPETPDAGMPVERLGYDPARWQQMMANLAQMAAQEGLEFSAHAFTTNSHKGLLLAEAAKLAGRDVFYRVHQGLFEAFFREQANIADTAVLNRIGTAAGMPATLIEAAWTDSRFQTRLQHYHAAANELDVRATPTFFIGEQRLDGAVPTTELQRAAQVALASA